MVCSGFGVAGSVLGAVVAAFALASAIVAFGVWPAAPPSSDLAPLTVEPAKHAPTPRGRDGAIVLPAPGGAAGTAVASSGSAGGAGDSSGRRRGGRRSRAGAAGRFAPGAPDTNVNGRPPDATPAPRKPGAAAPLAKVGGAVDHTTRSLGNGVAKVTADLGKGLAPLSPQLGAAVAKTGDALAKTVQDLGTAVAALLGYVKPASPPR
jgi:hypothetical protein